MKSMEALETVLGNCPRLCFAVRSFSTAHEQLYLSNIKVLLVLHSIASVQINHKRQSKVSTADLTCIRFPGSNLRVCSCLSMSRSCVGCIRLRDSACPSHQYAAYTNQSRVLAVSTLARSFIT
jgi:hypothetical protein